MKRLLLAIAITIPIVASAAPSGGPVPTFSPEDDGTHISLWIPGFLIKAAAGIVKNEDETAARLISSFGTTSIKVIEGPYCNQKKYQRKMVRIERRMDRRNYRDLIEIHTSEETVLISHKKKRSGKQKLIITVIEENTFVYIKTRCNVSFPQLIKIASSYDT